MTRIPAVPPQKASPETQQTYGWVSEERAESAAEAAPSID